MPRSSTVLLALLAIAAARPATTRAQGGTPALAFTNITVVDVVSGNVQPASTVVVTGRRITAVGPTARVAVPAGARVVDATGKFMIPGLWDMHVHSAYNYFDAIFPPLYIANGITGVREMFGELSVVAKWRDKAQAGDTAWPRIVAPGHIVDGPKPIWPTSVVARDAESGRRLVDSLKARGADFIKVYSLLPRDAYFAIAARATELHIPYAGHVTYGVTAAEASDAGQRSIEHLDGILRACSTEEVAMQPAVRRVIAAGYAYDSLVPVARPQARQILATYSADKCRDLAARFAKNGTWLSPTLVVLRNMANLDDTTMQLDPRLRYIPKSLSSGWDPKSDFRRKGATPETYAFFRAEYAKNREVLKLMHAAGVPVIAGTDVLNPFCLPGFSLHDELALYVESGLSPIEALRTATVNPAKYLGATDSLGTIAPGKLADLVILDANPLADIRNTTRISGVVANGAYVDSAGRQALLDRTERLLSPGKPKD